ncbi:hypothetical protein MMC17_004147 [Xylographa soralifera]|nr:hypothetical protein [Xylographa soralifera]
MTSSIDYYNNGFAPDATSSSCFSSATAVATAIIYSSTGSSVSTSNPTNVNLYGFPLPSSAFSGPGDYSSSGSIYIFTDNQCENGISSTGTPIKFGDCLDTPFAVSIEIASLPACLNGTTPLIVLSDLQDCVPAKNGSNLQVVEGNVQQCINYNGNDVRSVQRTCYGIGTNSDSDDDPKSMAVGLRVNALWGRRWTTVIGGIVGVLMARGLLW